MIIDIAAPSDIISTLEELNPEAILYDGFDDAVVGMAARCGTEPLAVYDRSRCIDILLSKGLSVEDAEEYFAFNVEGCWAGPHTPFIASFDLKPVGVRFPVEDFDGIEAKQDAAAEFMATFRPEVPKASGGEE
jgi:hypothetical protein|tara:strand:+ start:219 stop:617 length:399 start_codon:yes stop_codon:yes gene_type:complete